MLRNPTEIMIYACALMSFWAGLYGAEMRGKILEGGEDSAFLCAMGDDPAEAPPPPRLMLGSTQEEFEDEPPSDRD